jgi:shikimate dehydrogenase
VTSKYAIIGDPVEHSLSPAMQNAAFAATGIDARYEALAVRKDELEASLRTIRAGYAGFNVTTPLKEAIVPFMSGCTDKATNASAVNTVRIDRERMTGHNTDGDGFIAALADAWKFSPRGRSICFLGSGPAARAIALAVRAHGAARIACWSRNPLTAAEIGDAPDHNPDLVVSALPPSAEIPADVMLAIAGARYVFDLNYRAARSPVPPNVGEKRVDGLTLLLHQGALAFTWWTGVPAPLQAMREALRDA